MALEIKVPISEGDKGQFAVGAQVPRGIFNLILLVSNNLSKKKI